MKHTLRRLRRVGRSKFNERASSLARSIVAPYSVKFAWHFKRGKRPVTMANPLRVVFVCGSGQGLSSDMAREFRRVLGRSRKWFDVRTAGLFSKESYELIRNAPVLVSGLDSKDLLFLLRRSKIVSRPVLTYEVPITLLWGAPILPGKWAFRELKSSLMQNLEFK